MFFFNHSISTWNVIDSLSDKEMNSGFHDRRNESAFPACLCFGPFTEISERIFVNSFFNSDRNFYDDNQTYISIIISKSMDNSKHECNVPSVGRLSIIHIWWFQDEDLFLNIMTIYDILFVCSLWRYQLIRENQFAEVDHDATNNVSKKLVVLEVVACLVQDSFVTTNGVESWFASFYRQALAFFLTSNTSRRRCGWDLRWT